MYRYQLLLHDLIARPTISGMYLSDIGNVHKMLTSESKAQEHRYPLLISKDGTEPLLSNIKILSTNPRLKSYRTTNLSMQEQLILSNLWKFKLNIFWLESRFYRTPVSLKLIRVSF